MNDWAWKVCNLSLQWEFSWMFYYFVRLTWNCCLSQLSHFIVELKIKIDQQHQQLVLVPYYSVTCDINYVWATQAFSFVFVVGIWQLIEETHPSSFAFFLALMMGVYHYFLRRILSHSDAGFLVVVIISGSVVKDRMVIGTSTVTEYNFRNSIIFMVILCSFYNLLSLLTDSS
jgi:hypothetical protein